MEIRKSLKLVHDCLEKSGIDHALIGGMALAAHGVIRNTVDVDFLIDGMECERVKTAMETAGFVLDFESPEAMRFTGAGMIDFLLANRPMSRKMLELANIVPSFGFKIVKAEDIIGLKIQAYKNDPKRELQDKADIQAIIAKNKNLDWEKIKTYADLFNEWDEIQKIKENT